MQRPYHISADKRQQLAGIVVLNTLVDNGGSIPLLLEDNDLHLEPILDWLFQRGHLTIADNESYTLSKSGALALERYHQQYREFLLTFDIYSSVDLDEGVFAFDRIFDFGDESDWDEFLGRDCWSDLRIPIAELKGIDPVLIVFLSFDNEGVFHEENNWQLALVGDTFWQEIERICNDAIAIDDLGFDDPEDGRIEGEEFLEDIIKEGTELNLELKRAEQELEDDDDDEEEEEEFVEEYYHSYYDPYYVSPVWMALWIL